MTRDEMNGRYTKKMTGRILAVFAPAFVLLSACAGAFEADRGDTPPDARVQALVDENRQYPQWSEFPKASGEVPGARDIAARVEALSSANVRLAGDVGRLTWSFDDPVGFEAQVRERLAAVPPSPDSARTLQQLEAWAEDLRRRGEAPPPIGRRQ